MKLQEAIKPISYLKAHASEIVKDIVENHKTMIITQNGEARVIVQDIETYEETQETLSLLKILALSQKNKNVGNVKSLTKAFADIRKRIKTL